MLFDYLSEALLISRTGSLTEAAKVLSTSQATLSRHLDALENDLGVRLFKRVPHGIELTNDGMKILDCSKGLVDIEDSIHFYLATKAKRRSLTIYCELDSPSVVEKVMQTARTLSSTSEGSSGISELRLVFQTPAVSLQDIAQSKETSLVYVTMESSEILRTYADKLKTYKICTDHLVVITSSTDPLTAFNEINISSLEGRTVFHSEDSFYGSRTGWAQEREILRQAGVTVHPQCVTLRSNIDWYALDFTKGVLVIPSMVGVVSTFIAMGYRAIPIICSDLAYIAAANKEDPLACNVLRAMEHEKRGHKR